MDKQLKQDCSWVRGAAIGRGSYGTVSLAMKKKPTATAAGGGVVFAVKSVDTSSCWPSQIEALETEIEILRSLSSPYVVEYLGDDVTVEESSAFRNLHMEYLSGGCIADVARLRRAGIPLTAEDEKMIRSSAFCVASGLKYLHSQGIVHCDIKADNVLVGPTPGAAKLVDLGSAAAAGASRRRGNNRIVPRGSPLWMAPEVIRGEYQGPESDVWSLGCTVIEMVTGKPAWEDRSAAQTICRIGYSDELPRIPPQLSELGRDFVEKCLHRDVCLRWSCDQLLQHPFISKCAPPTPAESATTYSSPRCVFDWFNSDSEEEVEEYEERGTICNSKNLKDMIGKLASGGGAIWETDGWITVRRLPEEEVSVSSLWVSDTACCGGDEYGGQREGTNRGYWEVGGVGLEDKCDCSLGNGESSMRTSGAGLIDSLNCSAVVGRVRNDPRRHERDGVVTDSNGGLVTVGVDEFEETHSTCNRNHPLQLLDWILMLYMCRQLLDFDAYMKIFRYIFILTFVDPWSHRLLLKLER